VHLHRIDIIIAVYGICGLRERQQQTGLAFIALCEGKRKRKMMMIPFERIKKRLQKNMRRK
jgi:hypothetical protein